MVECLNKGQTIDKEGERRMTFLESILFLILYVSIGAGIPLLWYATKTPRRENNE